LIPRTTLLGALLGLGTMLGAIFSHIFVLGIEVQNDGGTLFILAVVTLISCLLLVYPERNKIPDLLRFKL
jgi:ABC-type thiamin/hydroxymethylpyrimidine transport system permease subunit